MDTGGLLGVEVYGGGAPANGTTSMVMVSNESGSDDNGGTLLFDSYRQ